MATVIELEILDSERPVYVRLEPRADPGGLW